MHLLKASQDQLEAGTRDDGESNSVSSHARTHTYSLSPSPPLSLSPAPRKVDRGTWALSRVVAIRRWIPVQYWQMPGLVLLPGFPVWYETQKHTPARSTVVDHPTISQERWCGSQLRFPALECRLPLRAWVAWVEPRRPHTHTHAPTRRHRRTQL